MRDIYSSEALKRVVANAKFTNQEIDIPLVKDALKDLFVISAKMVSIETYLLYLQKWLALIIFKKLLQNITISSFQTCFQKEEAALLPGQDSSQCRLQKD